MCGLAGLVFADPRTSPSLDHRSDVAVMLRELAHRGPDGERIVTLPGAVLGHRRLAIIDLTERASQPMALRCRDENAVPPVWIVFNGEIYNYVELRRDLAARGHRFSSDSDTETILHLYEEEGVACVRRLRGMFALALWDAGARRLMMARDRMGEKPLFYRESPEGLAFASEVKALAALARARGERVEPSPAALGRYLTLKYVPGPGTAVEGILEVPPASILTWQSGRAAIECYWKLPPAAAERSAGAADLRAELRETIDEAVRLRMRSDVPLGLFLSGGLDSGVIASAMTRAARASGAGPLRTFTVGFGLTDYDELKTAAKVARSFGTDHHEIVLRPAPLETIDLLPQLASRMDQPFADSSALAVHRLAEEVRKHVTVALSGDGGDELFLGYDRYRAHRMADRVGATLGRAGTAASRSAARLLAAAPGVAGRRNFAGRARRFLGAAGLAPLARNDVWISCIDPGLAASILSPDLAAMLAGGDPLAAHHRAYAGDATGDELLAIQRADLLVYLPDDILRKVDLATMTHGLEARAPLLDHHVVELALRIPPGMKLRGGRGKAILRETFAGDLPVEVVRGRKAGFGLPLDHWLRNEMSGYVRDLLLEPRSMTRGLMNRTGVEKLLAEHREGAANREDAIWALVMLEHWFRAAIDASRVIAAVPSRAATGPGPA